MLKKVEVGKTYQNKKTGQLYRVEGMGLHTELGTPHVRYIPLYHSEHSEFYRPLYDPKVGFKVKFEEVEDIDTK